MIGFFSLLLTVLLSTDVLAFSPCELNFLSQKKHQEIFGDLARMWYPNVGRLELDIKKIKSVNQLPQEIQGEINEGIFRVNTDEGAFVLKVLGDLGDNEASATQILLQKHLGELGLAPKVKGVYLNDSLTELNQVFPDISNNSWYAIMMHEVDGVMVKDALIGRGSYSVDLSSLPNTKAFKNKVIQNLNAAEKVLNQLQLKADDIQMMITKDGEVKLLDFDFYRWEPDQDLRGTIGYEPIKLDKVRELFK